MFLPPFHLTFSFSISWTLGLTWVESLRGSLQHRCPRCSWMTDNGDRGSVSRQDNGMESSIGLLVRIMSLQATAMPCPYQGCPGWGMQQRRYLQLPVSTHYHVSLLFPPPLITDFPEGHWSAQIKKFSCSFSMFRRQCYKSDAFNIYYSLHELSCLPRGINLKFPNNLSQPWIHLYLESKIGILSWLGP